MLAAELKASAELWRWGGRLERADQDFSAAINVEPVLRALSYQK